MIDPERGHLTAVKDVVDGVIPEPVQEFGVDYDGPIPDEQSHTVDVPEPVLCVIL